MIYFLMTNSTSSVDEEYINTMLYEVLAPENVTYEKINIIEHEGIYNFQVALEDGTEFFIEILHRSYSKVNYLDVYIKESIGEFVTNKFIERLKISLKNNLLQQWEQCHWIRDSQSADLSEKVYVKIHRLENKFREAINIVMLRRYGGDWWERYAPIPIQKKYHERKRHFQTVAPSFKGVEDKLLSIDVSDLINIIKGKKSTLDIENVNSLVKSFESVLKFGKLDEMINSYKNFENEFNKHLVIEEDLWKDIFSNHFDEEFFKKWASFNKGRNHIAHNKLVDTTAYNKIIKDISEIEVYLDELNQHLELELSDEEIKIMLEEMEEQSTSHMLEIMELDTGVEIKSEDDIVEDFNEYIRPFLNEIEDLYYFRDDIEVEINEVLQNEQAMKILTLSKEEVYASIECVLEVDAEQGQDSTLILNFTEANNVIVTSTIKIINGQADYDSDKGYYVAIVNNEIYSEDFEDYKSNVKELLDDLFHDYREDLSFAQEVSIRNGGNAVIADFACEECGEEYISIDGDVYEYGKCANCGHLHEELNSCERCEVIYNMNIDGTEMFCDNCISWIEEQ